MKKEKINNFKYKMITLTVLFIIILIAVFGGYEISRYDDSVFDVYAKQQDAYVQLVLDQINIQADRSDEQIITEILGSLDTSNNKYWTLSKDQALLFVKNVTETNRYKGFTTETYYVSDSAEKFLDSLTINHVIHKTIKIEDDRYVASGVAFEYNGAQYKVCLLTNETVILDNNTYLFTKIIMYIYIAVLLIIVLVLTMIFVNVMELNRKKKVELELKIETLNKNIDTLEDKIKALNYYQTRWSLFHGSLLKTFVTKLDERKVNPITFVKIEFEHKKNMQEFLDKAQLLLDDKVLRFSEGRRGLILIFVQYRREEAVKALNNIKCAGTNIEKIVTSENSIESLMNIYNKFKEQ